MSNTSHILPLLFSLSLSCSSNQDIQKVTPAVFVQSTSIKVKGPMPVLMAENMVQAALPALQACWKADQTRPCGTITVSYQDTRHGHRKKSVEGSLKAAEFRQCVDEIISNIRPPIPELASPESGLTVKLVYAPSPERLKSCQ